MSVTLSADYALHDHLTEMHSAYLPEVFIQPKIDLCSGRGDLSVPGDDREGNLTENLLKGNHAQVEAATIDVAGALRVENALDGAEPPRHCPGTLRSLAWGKIDRNPGE